MKIAIVSDDGVNISQHFGRAPYYIVVTVENGMVTHKETRAKVAHGHGHGSIAEPHVHHGGEHGASAAEHDTHARMAHPIADCEALLARGMGQGAYVSLRQLNVRPVITDISDVDAAVAAYIAGTIVDHTERLH
jgi:predicted Fe-Mo cluster-binding NifX family protein